MTEQDFLNKHVFQGLTPLTEKSKGKDVPFFSAADFAIVLERAEYFGISIYSIEPWFEGAAYGVMTNEELRKKASDARWYTKAFQTFEFRQAGMTYSASLKVSPKLLARKEI